VPKMILARLGPGSQVKNGCSTQQQHHTANSQLNRPQIAASFRVCKLPPAAERLVPDMQAFCLELFSTLICLYGFLYDVQKFFMLVRSIVVGCRVACRPRHCFQFASVGHKSANHRHKLLRLVWIG
jgi:hypothetical protein